MNRLLFVVGTRPEAIKMAPVIEEAKSSNILVCLTGQHPGMRELLPELEDNQIVELNLPRGERGLAGLAGKILCLMDDDERLNGWKADSVVVHGDTTSALCGALYAFYSEIRLCHVEAGLRTWDKSSPFPEEANRKIIDYLSDLHFAPHELNRDNLKREGVNERVHVVGNTAIDALVKNLKDDFEHEVIKWVAGDPFAIVTLHRRENWGDNINKMMSAISEFAANQKYKVVYVKHKNPSLKSAAERAFGGNEFVMLSEAIGTADFHNLLARCDFVMTDSGGIQEEASHLGKPLLVLRGETERQEIVEQGSAKLVSPEGLMKSMLEAADGKQEPKPPLYGDGSAGKKIARILADERLQ